MRSQLECRQAAAQVRWALMPGHLLQGCPLTGSLPLGIADMQ
jgi:hypothetical protein